MESTNNPYVRHIPCGSYSGYGTARDLAKLMGILANGGTHDGKSYISPKTTKLLTEVLTEGFDEVIIEWVPYGRGTGPLKTPLVGALYLRVLNIILKIMVQSLHPQEFISTNYIRVQEYTEMFCTIAYL